MIASIKGNGANRIAPDFGSRFAEHFTLLVEITNTPRRSHKGNIDQSGTLRPSKCFHLDEVSDGCSKNAEENTGVAGFPLRKSGGAPALIWELI